MSAKSKVWNVCDECFDPLARDLLNLVNRFRICFNLSQYDNASAEYEALASKASPSDSQAGRLTELRQMLQGIRKPACAAEIPRLYHNDQVEAAAHWLRFARTVEYGNDFRSRLEAIKQRFFRLELRAREQIDIDIMRFDWTYHAATSFPVYRVIYAHDRQIEQLFPDRDERPEWHELSESMQTVEREIVDEYDDLANQIREAIRYLHWLATLVRSMLRSETLGGNSQGIDDNRTDVQTEKTECDQPKVVSGKWAGPDDPVPSKFKHGPIEAPTLERVAAWYYDESPGKSRRLETIDRKDVFIQQIVRAKSYRVWFVSDKKHAEVRYRMLSGKSS